MFPIHKGLNFILILQLTKVSELLKDLKNTEKFSQGKFHSSNTYNNLLITPVLKRDHETLNKTSNFQIFIGKYIKNNEERKVY